MSISNAIVSTKIYDTRNNLNIELDLTNFYFMEEVNPRLPSYGVYISQHIRFARVCSNTSYFNNRNICLIAGYLIKVVCMINIVKEFLKSKAGTHT